MDRLERAVPKRPATKGVTLADHPHADILAPLIAELVLWDQSRARGETTGHPPELTTLRAAVLMEAAWSAPGPSLSMIERLHTIEAQEDVPPDLAYWEAIEQTVEAARCSAANNKNVAGTWASVEPQVLSESV